MPNLQHYVLELGHESFEDRTFGEADSLALTQIVYMPMEGHADGGEATTVGNLWAFLRERYPEGFGDPFQHKRYHLTEACAQAGRFFALPVLDYVNHVDARKETQFCACTFALPGGARYVAFRGTDLTLAGWKEDLNMSFMRVPAQARAVAYLKRAAEAFDGPLLLGGHSKGGHLSLYAAAHAPRAVQARIRSVYSFDGQGVDEQTLRSPGYARISGRVESFIPQSSVVGMLLCYHPTYHVVRSSALGLWQHDALTWQIRDARFERLEGLDLGTRLTDEALRQWIDGLSLSERRMLTDTVFRLIAAVDPETVDPLVQNLPGSTVKLIAAFRKLEPEARSELRRLLGELFASGANEAARMLLPAAFRRLVEAPRSHGGHGTASEHAPEAPKGA
ncbi:MAG: DUF2974 domain-containing protein [Clostridiales bacterium]|nr:DUF2974 domain-containing protein [Clostridiales bacterium]